MSPSIVNALTLIVNVIANVCAGVEQMTYDSRLRRLNLTIIKMSPAKTMISVKVTRTSAAVRPELPSPERSIAINQSIHKSSPIVIRP